MVRDIVEHHIALNELLQNFDDVISGDGELIDFVQVFSFPFAHSAREAYKLRRVVIIWSFQPSGQGFLLDRVQEAYGPRVAFGIDQGLKRNIDEDDVAPVAKSDF